MTELSDMTKKYEAAEAEIERLKKLKDRQTNAVIEQEQGVRRLVTKLDRLEVIERAARVKLDADDAYAKWLKEHHGKVEIGIPEHAVGIKLWMEGSKAYKTLRDALKETP